MNLELFIAKKIHFSKEGDREVTPPAVRIAMIGIALIGGDDSFGGERDRL